ncbi:hypothetical protein BC332_04037 [Capsicum chinense]|nr:hypothetical protein BC332_04037 [Capsicum chinense]
MVLNFTTFCSDENSLAAELKSVHWLEVFGRIDTAALTPETLYEVAFVEKIKENADGLESIFLRLIIPNKSSNEVTVNLMNVTETEKLNCKHGLVIKGIKSSRPPPSLDINSVELE